MFKVGDKVRVIACFYGHEFEIGEVVTIESIDGRSYYCKNYEDTWCLGEDEFELIEIKFNIGDKVRVVECLYGHRFEIGEVVAIKSFFKGSYRCCNNKECWSLSEDELEMVNNKASTQEKHSHYHKTITGFDGTKTTVDVYRVLDAFEVNNPQLQHLIKKALCAGNRGHKDYLKDLQDIIDSAKNAIDMYKQKEGM